MWKQSTAKPSERQDTHSLCYIIGQEGLRPEPCAERLWRLQWIRMTRGCDSKQVAWQGSSINFVSSTVSPMGLSRWLDGEEPACQYRSLRRRRFYPWIGKISCRRNGDLLQHSCLENPMDRGNWWATVHRVAKSWTRLTHWAHMHPSLKEWIILWALPPGPLSLLPQLSPWTLLLQLRRLFYFNVMFQIYGE